MGPFRPCFVTLQNHPRRDEAVTIPVISMSLAETAALVQTIQKRYPNDNRIPRKAAHKPPGRRSTPKKADKSRTFLGLLALLRTRMDGRALFITGTVV